MPCRPPIAFCRTVGQAIFQTAGTIGPSTIDRSKLGRFLAGAAAIVAAGVTRAEVAAGAAARRSEGTIARDHNSLLPHRLDGAADVGMGHDDGRLALERVEIAAVKTFAVLRRGQQLFNLVDERRGICIGRR